VKRFQRSLEVNAILHEKWVGPGAGKRPPAEESSAQDQDRVSNRELIEDPHLNRDSELSRSAPDLRKRGTGAAGKGNEKQKKKPFRTVVDWCRPHTPLKIDPTFKGGMPQTGERERGGSRSEDRALPHLPQIK